MICDQILEELDKLYPNDNFNDIIVNKRQMIHLVEASNFLDDSLDLIKSNEPEEFILQKLRLSIEAINLIIGESTNEDMLDMLFKNFCIGK